MRKAFVIFLVIVLIAAVGSLGSYARNQFDQQKCAATAELLGLTPRWSIYTGCYVYTAHNGWRPIQEVEDAGKVGK